MDQTICHILEEFIIFRNCGKCNY